MITTRRKEYTIRDTDPSIGEQLTIQSSEEVAVYSGQTLARKLVTLRDQAAAADEMAVSAQYRARQSKEKYDSRLEVLNGTRVIFLDDTFTGHKELKAHKLVDINLAGRVLTLNRGHDYRRAFDLSGLDYSDSDVEVFQCYIGQNALLENMQSKENYIIDPPIPTEIFHRVMTWLSERSPHRPQWALARMFEFLDSQLFGRRIRFTAPGAIVPEGRGQIDLCGIELVYGLHGNVSSDDVLVLGPMCLSAHFDGREHVVGIHDPLMFVNHPWEDLTKPTKTTV